MQYVELKEKLKDFTIFSLADIRKLESSFHRRRLNEWQDKKYIKKIIKGYYIFSDITVDENVLFRIASRIYEPSYISLEMALSRYGLIPESVYGVTSVTTRRTRAFKTETANFIYRTLKPELFFGYAIAGPDKARYGIASCEKAVLDYFYLNPSIKDRAGFESLRIDKENYRKIVDEKKLRGYLVRFGNKALSKRVSAFLREMKNA